MLIYLILIPISIIILNIWLWLFNNIFKLPNKNKIIIITICIGLVSGLSIIFFPKILAYFNLGHLDFTLSTENFTQQIGYFGLYLFILILISKFILGNFRFSKFFLINIAAFGIIFLIGGWIGDHFSLSDALKYYIFVALGEEFAKYLLGVNFYEKYKISGNDIILFSIISGIGFAFVENLVYMSSALTDKGLLTAFVGGVSVLISRGLIGFLVHIIFTGNIGLISSKGLYKNMFLFAIIGILVGSGLHYGYDILLHNQVKITIIVFLVFGYFWISYLFYKSDRLYINQGLQNY